MRYNRKNKRLGKYSLTENLLAGGGLGLITEMQMSPADIQTLADELLKVPGSGKSAGKRSIDAGKAGEAFIRRHLGGTDTDTIEKNFPMADVYVGDLNNLANSGGSGGSGGLIFYSVKASSQTGVHSWHQQLNANAMANKLDSYEYFLPDQTECKIRFGVYVLTIDYDNDSIQVAKSDLHTILLKKGEDGSWTAVDVQEQASKLDRSKTTPHPHFNGGNDLRKPDDFAGVGLELSEVGVGAFNKHTGARGDSERKQILDPDVHDTNKPYMKQGVNARSRRTGFKGSPSKFPGKGNDLTDVEI